MSFIDNTFSIFTTKYVSVDIRFVHEGADVARVREIERKAQERDRRVGEILGKLVKTLQEMERGWGTRQITPPIYLAIDSANVGLNAFAVWNQQLVILTRGILEFVETLPAEQGDKVQVFWVANWRTYFIDIPTESQPARWPERPLPESEAH